MRAWAPAVALLLAGCLTVADLPRHKSEGRAETYPVTFDEAWAIAQAVFRWGGAEAIDEHRDEGYMTTTGTLTSRGTLMAAWVERVDAANTRVIVVMKRQMDTSVFLTLTEATFHRRFAETVQRITAERPPPKPAP